MAGDKTALGEAIAVFDAAADDEEQGELFAAPSTLAGDAKLNELQRRPGRPAGSRNKRTERTVAWLLSRYRDPRAVLLELAEANAADLAGRFNCSLLEALQEKRIAAAAVLPYVAARMPIAIDVTKRTAVYLNVQMGHAVQAAEGEGIGFAVEIGKALEYQEVSEAPPAQVGQEEVGQDAQAIDIAHE